LLLPRDISSLRRRSRFVLSINLICYFDQEKEGQLFLCAINRLVTNRGKNKATMAAAHSLLIAIFHILSGKEFKDLGADFIG